MAVVIATALLGTVVSSPELAAQSLRGSSSSMDQQERQAIVHDFSYLRDAAQVTRFVNGGYLVPVRGNSNYRLKGVSFPYTRPEARLFIERLAGQYRAACGEQLVVTSLTRTLNRQPRNASTRSVHPTGMALDLRRSNSSACRSWLERVLLSLEKQGVLEATRERRPPHYHIAIFPTPYSSYVTQLAQRTPEQKARAERNSIATYEVRRGDSLWTIARAHGTTVDQLKAINSMRGSSIYAGQTLQVPATR